MTTRLTIGRAVPALGVPTPRLRDVFLFPKVPSAPSRLRVSIPLARLALCLNDDCGHAFEIGGPCPQCGSEQFVLLDSFLRPRDPNAAPLPWKVGRGPVA